MSTAIQPVQTQVVVPWKSTSAIKQRAEAIQQLLREVMNEATQQSNWDGDFGKIPGTGGKPSLLKAGSEKILAMFEMAVDPMVEDLSTEDCRRYRVTCRILHAPSGNFLGSGVGECSTDETKYKWKKTYSKQEYDATDPDRRRMKYTSFKDGNGMNTEKAEMQIRTEPADLANTVLKMAKKRAQIDATLTVTGASSMFTQDELEPESEVGGTQASTKGKRSAKSAPKQQEDVKCAQCQAVNGHLPSCKYHPKNQSGTGRGPTTDYPLENAAGEKSPNTIDQGVEARRVAEAATAAKIQGEVMPKETKKKPEVPKELTQETVVVKAYNEKPKKTGKGVFGEIIVTTEDNKEAYRYTFHATIMEALSTAVGKLCIWETKPSGSFVAIEKLHQVGTVVYVDGKPVQAPSAAEVGFEPAEPEGDGW